MVRIADELGMATAPFWGGGRGLPGEEEDPEIAAWNKKSAEMRRRLKEEFGEDRIAQNEEAERKKREADSEAQGMQEITRVAQESGISAEDAEAFFNRIKSMEPELKAKFEAQEEAAKNDAEREAVKNTIKAELEKIATEHFGAEKAKAFIQKLDKKP